MDMPGRQYSSADGYRYGFNGKEKDNKDGVVQYDYGFRIYDPRLMRFKSVDPLTKEYPWNSPYSYAEGDVIRCIDLDGLEKLIVTEYYDKDGNKTRTVLSGMRSKETKEAVNMNMKSALNIKLTTQDVYVIRYNSKGKIFFEGPGGKLDKYYKGIIAKAPTDEGEEDETLPDNTMQQTEITSRGRFVKSAFIDNVANEFFEKTIRFKTITNTSKESFTEKIGFKNEKPDFATAGDIATVSDIARKLQGSSINTKSTITINFQTTSTSGDFKAADGSTMNGTKLIGDRFRAIQNVLVSQGVPLANIKLGTVGYKTPTSAMGGANNLVQFNVEKTTTTTKTVTQ